MAAPQEIVFASSDPKVSRAVSRQLDQGTLRKLAPKIYSTNLADAPEAIVQRNLFLILGHLYPKALLSHRSAMEFQPTATGQLFLTYTYTRKILLPGITLRFLEGPPPAEGDRIFSGQLHVSQRERAFLENLQTSRKHGPDSKTLSFPELEERLEQIIRVNGEEALNAMRDRAQVLSVKLGMKKEFSMLNKLCSALLSTHPAKMLTSPVAAARAMGSPYDPARIELFASLFQTLQKSEFKYHPEPNTSTRAFRNFAFFESYFSNYIEGTVFELPEAREIVASQRPLTARNEDSHDILGTYQLVSSPEEMQLLPETANDLLDILKRRHKILLSARKEQLPGQFKTQNNFAGQTAFVDRYLVRGTLIKAFDYYRVLVHPFARAAYLMFVISEVHPFQDGNGRIARVMMNAELVHGNQAKIIIPTVYRDDYLGTLRQLTRRKDPISYLRMLARAHAFSATIAGEDEQVMERQLERSNAFMEHTEGILQDISD